MDNISNIFKYLWYRLPLILLFVNAYLVYRLIVVTNLSDIFVYRSLQYCRGKLNLLLLYIIIAAVLLSFFIPNAVTVLTLIPVLKILEKDISAQTNGKPLTTALTLSVIYGANIGGMGSLIGSPANLMLIGALDLYAIPGREKITFLNWFIWSVPLVTLFSVAAWGIIAVFAVPHRSKKINICLKDSTNRYKLTLEKRYSFYLFSIFVCFWIFESTLKGLFPFYSPYESYACITFLILFLYFTFITPSSLTRVPLLSPRQLFTGIPTRGIIFLGLLVLVVTFVRVFQLDRWAASIVSNQFNPNISQFSFFLLTTLTVIFSTELLSNTAVSTIFFPIAYYSSTAHDILPLSLMIAVSIASTCAFMTPIATPCNALAYGEMKGTSLGKMLILGFMLNIIGALLMTVWLQFIIYRIYD
jgi:sodium-dependent dicarboxylate transporter 2/3/5